MKRARESRLVSLVASGASEDELEASPAQTASPSSRGRQGKVISASGSALATCSPSVRAQLDRPRASRSASLTASAVSEAAEAAQLESSSTNSRAAATQESGGCTAAHSCTVINEEFSISKVEHVTGSRICDMSVFMSDVLPHVQCPCCCEVGSLVARVGDEISKGLTGTVRFWCFSCEKHTLQWDHSKEVSSEAAQNAGKLGRKPLHQYEANVRAIVAAMQAGISQPQLEKFMGIMELPSLGDKAFNNVYAWVYPRCQDACIKSQERALELEKALAKEAGAKEDDEGRIPIPISFDCQWMKPGIAHNAPDGYGVAMGCNSGKCIMTAYRSKDGPLQNHVGPSGNMEPDMGAEIVCRLGDVANGYGVVVSSLCLDLDAKTPAVVAEAARKANLPVPRREHDPNHFLKALRKRFIDVKSKVGAKGVFMTADQDHLRSEVSKAIGQHRGTPKLRDAIMNVLSHAFNEHQNCRLYFSCPCAPDEHGIVSRPESKFKGGRWLNEVGDATIVQSLREHLTASFNAVTTQAHMDALGHTHNTQICEAVNSLHISLHAKRRNLSRSTMGYLLHVLTAARYNDGLDKSTEDVLAACGISKGHVSCLVLQKFDQKRKRIGMWKKSIHGKGKRKKAKNNRAMSKDLKGRDATAYCTGIGLDIDSDRQEQEVHLRHSNLTPSAEVVPQHKSKASGARGPRKCTICNTFGHDRRVCTQKDKKIGPIAMVVDHSANATQPSMPQDRSTTMAVVNQDSQSIVATEQAPVPS